MASKERFCSFCGARETAKNLLIDGMSGSICENCVERASEIFT